MMRRVRAEGRKWSGMDAVAKNKLVNQMCVIGHKKYTSEKAEWNDQNFARGLHGEEAVFLWTR